MDTKDQMANQPSHTTPTQAPSIDGETVTSIRKYLNTTQLLFDKRHDDGFDLSTNISQDANRTYSVQQFCLDFVRGNHVKRKARHKRRNKK